MFKPSELMLSLYYNGEIVLKVFCASKDALNCKIKRKEKNKNYYIGLNSIWLDYHLAFC